MAPFDFIIRLLQEYQFLFLFPATVIEGPIVTVVAAFLASLGTLNLVFVFLTAFAGDVTGDLIFYGLGRFGRFGVLDRYGRYIGLREEHVRKAEGYLHENSFRAVLAAKLLDVLGLALLFGIGVLRMKFWKFILASVVISAPKTLFFVGIGYFFGGSYIAISHYLNVGGSLLTLLIFIVVGYRLLRFLKGKTNNVISGRESDSRIRDF